MVAEKPRLLKDHLVVELMMSLPHPSAHTRNFDSAVWYGEKRKYRVSWHLT